MSVQRVYWLVLWSLILGLFCLVGCSDNGSDKTDAGLDAGEPLVDGEDGGDPGGDLAGDPGGDEVGDGDAGVEEVKWMGCFLYPDHSSQRLAECAMIEVPLRYAEPDGPQIEIWVQRLLGTATEKRGQIWFLHGGPGASGAAYAPLLDFLSEVMPEWDLYTLDHRGVGWSARLGCPDQELEGTESGFSIGPGEWDACLQHVQDTWGSDLAEFTTTGAARDLGVLIERLREPDRDVFVYGASYGVYLAIRYLQIHPQQVTGVILDSIAPPGISFFDYDVFFNDIGEDFIEYCQNDALCSSKLGADPWVTFGDVFSNVAGGSCPGFSALLGPGTERYYLRLTLGTLLMATAMRPFAPAAVYRLDRCAPEDVDALEQLLVGLFSPPGGPSAYDKLYGQVLSMHVGLSELWEDPLPDPADVDAMVSPLYFSVDLAPRVVALQDRWPFYPQDQYVGNWPSTEIPVLMMNGDLDPQTPPWLAAPAETHFTGTHHYYFTFPRCPHGIVGQSYVTTPGAYTCGVQMMVDFIDNPLVAPDSTCLADILPIDFTGVPGWSQYLFGTEDMWENTIRRKISTPAEKPPGFDRAVRWLRRSVPPPEFLR